MPLISDPFGGRSIEEWVGANPDARVPDKVRDRVFFRAKGICHISGRKIVVPRDRWQLEHVVPLSMGGEHREANMRPALTEAHKAKTAEEAGARAKADRMRRKANGTWPKSKTPLRSRGFDKTRTIPENK
ncbi:HNH endonuclease [Mesorhizobium sp. BE184]|uniref:HNH endonuclease n=1 Tax=Mesorhizobium sp. BE184 TaxID=2817714 RepID=UPI0028608390|nr:HNH endonuclease [Mesorhizobium sp. BE184]MDR7035229.1 5-methylcytosine-specific restriction endonuclease McrA [Mesorhizobium sp. BE184]